MRDESSRAPRVAPIDVPVRRLVRLLNRLPDCATISSCGGHAQPTAYQEPEGRWYVDLALEPTAAGWRSLTVLAWLCDETTGTTLTPWAEGPDGWLRFDLRGTHLSGCTLEANLSEHFARRRGRG